MSAKKIIIYTLSAGVVITLGYLFVRNKNKSKLSENEKEEENRKLEESDSNEGIKNKKLDKADVENQVPPTNAIKTDEKVIIDKQDSKNTTAYKTQNEITNNFSIESAKKPETFVITSNINIYFEKVVKKEKAEIVEVSREAEEIIVEKEKKQILIQSRKFSSDDESADSNNLAVRKSKDYDKEKENLRKSTFYGERKKTADRQSSPQAFNPNNMTYLSIVDDLNFDENLDNQIKKYIKDNNMVNKAQLNYSPLYSDEENRSGSEAGYLEEDDDEDLNSFTNNLMNKRSRLHTEDSIINIEKDFTQLKKDKKKLRNAPELELVKNDIELEKILSRKKSYKDNYNIQTEIVIADGESLEVIKGDLFLVILNHLYIDIHNDLCELANKSKEDRLKFILTDIGTYITKIENFIREKEEIFLCDLAEIHTKLNFNENVFNNSMNFYMKFSNSDDILYRDIIAAIDKLYTAGFKEIAAPASLNRKILLEILAFQCEKLEELKSLYNKKLSVYDVMLYDYTFLEYGLDREAILAARNKHNINEDEEFKVYILQLKDIDAYTYLIFDV